MNKLAKRATAIEESSLLIKPSKDYKDNSYEQADENASDDQEY